MIPRHACEPFPPMPLEGWRATKETLHRFAQIVGKLRLDHSVRRNHWWNVPFHLTGRGLTTRPMGWGDSADVYTIDLDFLTHEAAITTLDGRRIGVPLYGQSVSSFYTAVTGALHSLGIDAHITRPFPYDLPDAERPFADDTEHTSYDPLMATRYWRVLSRVNLLLEEFAAGYAHKVSPVHHFWHTFDIAVSLFDGRPIPHLPGSDPVIREAYSREVISFGFWFGDDTTGGDPAFYSYTAPEPAGLGDQPLRPSDARWAASGHGHLAVLPYPAARAAPDLRAAVLEFYESAYRAGADLAGWDTRARSCPGGVSDPVLAQA